MKRKISKKHGGLFGTSEQIEKYCCNSRGEYQPGVDMYDSEDRVGYANCVKKSNTMIPCDVLESDNSHMKPLYCKTDSPLFKPREIKVVKPKGFGTQTQNIIIPNNELNGELNIDVKHSKCAESIDALKNKGENKRGGKSKQRKTNKNKSKKNKSKKSRKIKTNIQYFSIKKQFVL